MYLNGWRLCHGRGAVDRPPFERKVRLKSEAASFSLGARNQSEFAAPGEAKNSQQKKILCQQVSEHSPTGGRCASRWY
jgi:hypothetical protein